MRLPIVHQISTKDGTSNKNARLTNVLKETRATGDLAVIRPGLETAATYTGEAKGLVCFNGELVSIYGSTIYRISDGTEFSEIYIGDGGDNKNWHDVVWNGSKFCMIKGNFGVSASDYSNIAATSTDGVDWEFQTLSSSKNWSGIAWNGNVFCAVNTDGGGSVSSDGVSWANKTVNIFGSGRSIAANGSIFAAISTTSVVNYSSDNGNTWGFVSIGHSFSTYGAVITSGGGLFCYIGESWSGVSSNGSSWTHGNPTYRNWTCIAWNGSVFCALAREENICAISPDGLNWTEYASLPYTAYWTAIHWNGSKYWAIGNLMSDGSPVIAESVNGYVWTGVSNALTLQTTSGLASSGSGDFVATLNMPNYVAVNQTTNTAVLTNATGNNFDFAQSPL